jgi:hypothetical protein
LIRVTDRNEFERRRAEPTIVVDVDDDALDPVPSALANRARASDLAIDDDPPTAVAQVQGGALCFGLETAVGGWNVVCAKDPNGPPQITRLWRNHVVFSEAHRRTSSGTIRTS